MRERILNGYRVIYFPNHPSAMKSNNWNGFIYEHIVKAERMLGRSLTKKEYVHHLNSNRLDNRVENLLVLECSQHTKLHSWLNNRSNEVVVLKYCLICGICLDNEQDKFCSSECQHKAYEKLSVSKEELEKLVWEKPTTQLAKEFNCSDKAIDKRCKKLGIKKPPPGYWSKVKANKK